MLPERRIYPRYQLHFPVEIMMELNDGGRVLSSESVNISRKSIELRGDGKLIAAFQSQQQYPQTCAIQFKIPGRDHVFHLQCQMMTHRRLSQHVFHVVLIFTRYEDDCEVLLQQYLDALPASPLNQQNGGASARDTSHSATTRCC